MENVITIYSLSLTGVCVELAFSPCYTVQCVLRLNSLNWFITRPFVYLVSFLFIIVQKG